MRRKGPSQEDPPPGGPPWIVSYCGMFTLLLAFFVVIQTMAKTREGILFRAGQDSFRRAVAGLGMPNLLFGQEAMPANDYRKIKYPTEQDEEDSDPERLIDAVDARIRKSFDDLKRRLKVESPWLEAGAAAMMPAPIRFEPGQAVLDEQAQHYLADFAESLARNAEPAASVKLYVIGLAADAPPGRRQWVLSAQRARAVENFLRNQLSLAGDVDWELTSWGAAQGGKWCDEFGLDPDRSFVAIAVVGADKN